MSKLSDNKVVSKEEAFDHYRDGLSYMLGGFGQCGQPSLLVKGLIERDIRDIHVISNDMNYDSEIRALLDQGKTLEEAAGILLSDPALCEQTVKSLLVYQNRVRSIQCTYIAFSRITGEKVEAGEITIEHIPQGTFVERIRCGGNGLGGVLTPTGVGTLVAQSKPSITVDGREYLVEFPLHADVALILARKADTMGNLVFHHAARNYSPYMASAADLVIVQAEELVPLGSLSDSEIMCPGIFVDYIVQGKGV